MVAAGRRVRLQIKKPVTLPFLDYGTLARREARCRAELLRHQRSALYLDVVLIGEARSSRKAPNRDRMGGAHAALRRERPLDRVRPAALQPAHLTQLAAALTFHEAAAVAAAETRFGAAQQVLAAAQENFIELRQLLPAGAQPQVEQLARWTDAEFQRRAADFAARKAGGRVREGHGDLHLGNLVLIEGHVTPFDCIEFNEDFRWSDVISEIAFVWTDLLDHRRPGLAAWLLNAAGNRRRLRVHGRVALTLCTAPWCAPVAVLRAGQQDAAQQQAELDPQARICGWHGSRRTASANSVITCGLSGSGKTTASSARLLDATATSAGSLVRLRSTSNALAFAGAAGASGSAPDAGIYTAGHRAHLCAVARLGARTAAAGWSVIVDAAFCGANARPSAGWQKSSAFRHPRHRGAGRRTAPPTRRCAAATPKRAWRYSTGNRVGLPLDADERGYTVRA